MSTFLNEIYTTIASVNVNVKAKTVFDEAATAPAKEEVIKHVKQRTDVGIEAGTELRAVDETDKSSRQGPERDSVKRAEQDERLTPKSKRT